MTNQTPIRAVYGGWRIGFICVVLQVGLALIFMAGTSLQAQTGAAATKTVNVNPVGFRVLTLTTRSGSGQGLQQSELPALRFPVTSVSRLVRVTASATLVGLLVSMGLLAQYTWTKRKEEEDIPFIPAHVPLLRTDRRLPTMTRADAAISSNSVASSQQNHWKSAAFGLSVACPFDQGNPSTCPLHEVRKMNLKERYEWIQRLSDESTLHLLTHHQKCLGEKKSLGKHPPTAFYLEASRSYTGLMAESVLHKAG